MGAALLCWPRGATCHQQAIIPKPQGVRMIGAGMLAVETAPGWPGRAAEFACADWTAEADLR